MWESAAYFLSQDQAIAEMAAGTYKALMKGENSGVESAAINFWGSNNLSKSSEIHKYITNFVHPVFNYKSNLLNIPVTPAALVSTNELAISMGLPRKSVCGFPVVEHAEFAKEIITTDQKKGPDFRLGKVFSMGSETETDVRLDINSLAAHTFVTGSTGSGKSNTIYELLDQLNSLHDIPFLVIEPAKGEYKDVFGGRKDVTVYVTNPYKYNELLQINPFSFPEDIHVLEHVDRVVEIFNACWPMYAAMPAILKESIERSYEECGWNLRTSKGRGVFPTFDTLLDVLPKVIDDSSYSSDTSSDYKGALVTRVRSLTRGIHGQIFTGDNDLKKLFNTNTIVDISRIGSAETKSLLMGILILKLQEFRMSEDVSNNSGLRHITVLEEAHNLLKKTSGDQSQEGANVQGKSVEMIANAIAEMRTYGEGFIIADQSPGLMDMSVIRNTNTKIIMRLPDESDRNLVGKAAGLTDEQIVELSKLSTGVAATYQSGWIEAVLCKVDYFEHSRPYVYNQKPVVDRVEKSIEKFMINNFLDENVALGAEDIKQLNIWVRSFNLNDRKRLAFEYAIQGAQITDAAKMTILLSVCRVNDFNNRPELIRRSREVVESLNIKQENQLKLAWEQLIVDNITEEGRKVERGIR